MWLIYLYNSFNNSVILLVITLYLSILLIQSNTTYKTLIYVILNLFWLTYLLYYFQFELFATLLLLSETIVGFFFFLIFLNKNNNWMVKWSTAPIFFYLLYGTKYTFYSIYWGNWYNVLFNLNNDVYVLYIFFFEKNVVFLGLFGLLLFILTLVITWMSFFWKKNNKQGSGNYRSFFFLKKQSKQNYVRKKPVFFKNKKNGFNDF